MADNKEKLLKDDTVTNKPSDKLDDIIEDVLEGELAPLDPANFKLGDLRYQLVKNYRDGFDYERLTERYNNILDRYDYIVGDWGYDQLRLKGFFEDSRRNTPADVRISALEDYLYEYCNFGCAYFVIKQLEGPKKKKGRPQNNRRKSRGDRQQAHINEKKIDTTKKRRNPTIKNKKDTQRKQPAEKPGGNTDSNRHFTIRKKES
ncbi:YutD family protein [Vagococcus acidifermentans]|uniref:Transcriptional regulator n=1 Tax=Vagococcus acidifermentans TaxID=564710 RepID=A0A430B0G4_9ENTE|nr:YutD family protein [Vagococcus acidifermentans]RSU13815.1 hypothetical protein CBF27_02640 [Vagococcus acidifermentans]